MNISDDQLQSMNASLDRMGAAIQKLKDLNAWMEDVPPPKSPKRINYFAVQRGIFELSSKDMLDPITHASWHEFRKFIAAASEENATKADYERLGEWVSQCYVDYLGEEE